jgi:hypothetical protein
MDQKNIAGLVESPLPRRSFMTRAGLMGLTVAAAAFLPGTPVRADSDDRRNLDNLSGDTAQEIFTAALIAEDLASTFYYNGLIGPVIMDPNLAGPGGSANNVTSAGNMGNVQYFQAALSEEIAHANLLRAFISKTSSSTDPVQTFYLPTGTHIRRPIWNILRRSRRRLWELNRSTGCWVALFRIRIRRITSITSRLTD